MTNSREKIVASHTRRDQKPALLIEVNPTVATYECTTPIRTATQVIGVGSLEGRPEALREPPQSE